MYLFENLLRKVGIFHLFSRFKKDSKTMKSMMPKDFIRVVLIKEVGEIHEKYPYIAFATMAIGIEFLGKCLNTHDDWNYYAKGVPKDDFELAINKLDSFTEYRPLLKTHNLWDSLRNGFTHSFVPKKTISLSSKNEAPNFKNISETKINLRCEDFYIAFKKACEEILIIEKFDSEKMNRPLLYVPDSSPDSNSGNTPSIKTSISNTI